MLANLELIAMSSKQSKHVFIVSLFFLLSFSCQLRSKQSTKVMLASKHVKHETTINSILYSKNNEALKADFKIATWNIQDLGQSKNQNEILQIAKIIKNFDVIAIQEVVAKDPRGAQAVAKLADQLNRMGSKWDYSISNPTKSPSANMSERYAYLWKTSKLRLVNKPYLDKTLEYLCVREPYIAKFRTKKSKQSFFLINSHSRVHDQHPEQEIIYFKDYPQRLNSDKIIILGDFNLNESHPVWDNLYTNGFKSALQNAPTTLKRKCKNGSYLNHSIDNIYYNAKRFQLINNGRVDFVGYCENLINARSISDHLPVFLEVNLDED